MGTPTPYMTSSLFISAFLMLGADARSLQLTHGAGKSRGIADTTLPQASAQHKPPTTSGSTPLESTWKILRFSLAKNPSSAEVLYSGGTYMYKVRPT